MQVLIINPGATSTKIAIYNEETEVYKKTIDHAAADLAPFSSILEQKDYRKQIILQTLESAGYSLRDFAAVCGRGGLLRHIPSGTYRVSDAVIDDVRAARYGEHASNLGALLARELGDAVSIPAFFVDPVCTDEMSEVARVSGCKGMERTSFFHALNHKAMAREASKLLGKAYEDTNLIVAHMGGGVSVAAHEKGRCVDVNNVRDDGAFSMDRGGGLPVTAVLELCFSGMTKAEAKKKLMLQSGLFSYLQTRDFREVEARMNAGEAEAKLIAEAMVYQLCKDMGAMAAVLRYEVDAIVLTGGMANSKWLCAQIEKRMGKQFKIIVLAGENEMKSLAEGALRVLQGKQEAKNY